jgi:hypothetical protein
MGDLKQASPTNTIFLSIAQAKTHYQISTQAKISFFKNPRIKIDLNITIIPFQVQHKLN